MDKHKAVKRRIRGILRKALGQELKKCDVSEFDIVAFDVFDTLIIREGISDPSDVFDMVGTKTSIGSYKNIRMLAEKEARNQANKAGREEVTIEEIYEKLAEFDGWDIEKCKKIIAIEIAIELNICYANVEALDFYKQVLNQNKRVLIISDMYLDKKTICTILENAGLSISPSDIFVSSEYGVTKKTGKLYEKVIKETKVDKTRLLMIGDNILSDYFAPKMKGIKAFLYKCGS